MFLECPHCFLRVGVMSDGICPACLQNVHNPPKENASKASLSIDHDASLPPFCFECATPTERYVKVKRHASIARRGDPDEGSEIMAFSILGLFCPGVGHLVIWSACALVYMVLWIARGGASSREGEVILVRMPQCDDCGAKGPPEPVIVSREQRLMTFVVHKTFKEEVQRRAGSAD